MKTTERDLLRFKKQVLKALRKEDSDFGLHLFSNAQMNGVRRELLARRDFKGAEARKIAREKMVSVLSFPEMGDFPHPESSKPWLGEVYLNLDFARRDTDRLGVLMVHGVLHLLGYRHDHVRDTIKMEVLEKNLRARLKIRDKK